MIIIKSIITEHITEQPFAGFIDPAELDDFAPYYVCQICFRIDDLPGNVTGTGDTEAEAKQAAQDALVGRMAAQVYAAMDTYAVEHGYGTAEIA